MSFRQKVLVTAVSMTAAAALAAAGTGSASAATPQCGSGCVEVFSRAFGTVDNPNFVETVSNGTAKAGQPTILAPPSSSDPAGDFLLHPGLVSDLAAKGMVTAAVNDHYGKLRATQIEFEPRGKPTGLCVGVAATPAQDEELSLQPCTVPGDTVWIIDVPDSSAKGFVPLVNGANADFSQPFTMTYNSDPSHTPSEPIRLRHLIKNNGIVPDQQLWSTKTGS